MNWCRNTGQNYFLNAVIGTFFLIKLLQCASDIGYWDMYLQGREQRTIWHEDMQFTPHVLITYFQSEILKTTIRPSRGTSGNTGSDAHWAFTLLFRSRRCCGRHDVSSLLVRGPLLRPHGPGHTSLQRLLTSEGHRHRTASNSSRVKSMLY